MILIHIFPAIVLSFLILAGSAIAQDPTPAPKATKPLWEVGVGAGVFYTPDYPAADKNSLHWLAMPYVIYRGEFLRVGKDSIIKGVFFDNDLVEFDLSAEASFNSNSDNNSARRGMPDLDYLFGLGPQVKIKLGTFSGSKTELQLPFHALFSTDLGRVDHRGYVFSPRISHRTQNIFNSGIDMDSSLSSSFATKKLHEYFYQVDPKYATDSRPAYEADGGYLGSRIAVGLSYGITERLRAYVGGGVGYYGGSANMDSPLFRRELNGSVHALLTWTLFQSDSRVTSNR